MKATGLYELFHMLLHTLLWDVLASRTDTFLFFSELSENCIQAIFSSNIIHRQHHAQVQEVGIEDNMMLFVRIVRVAKASFDVLWILCIEHIGKTLVPLVSHVQEWNQLFIHFM